jgi:hypothetical protein
MRIKLIFQDKMTSFVLIISSILFLLIITFLSNSAEERSSIPIGLLNLDKSDSSNQLVTDLKGVPAFYIYEDKEEKLKDLLYDEQISAYFVIEEGYEKAIQVGRNIDLVTMYYLEGSQSSKILSDIFAGEMLYKMSLYKSLYLYNSLKQNQEINEHNEIHFMNDDEFINYMNQLIDKKDFDFAFDIKMIHVKSGSLSVGNNTSNNAILYQQVIWGILGMVLSFIILFIGGAGLIQEKELGIDKRLKLVNSHPFWKDCNYLLIMLMITGILSTIIIFIIGLRLPEFTAMDGLNLFILNCLFVGVVGAGFLLITKFIRKLGMYQLVGVITILFMGICGFLSVVKGLIPIYVLNLLKFTPNNWFIQGFTDIIINNTLQDIPFDSYIRLTLTAIVLIIINTMLGVRQNH